METVIIGLLILIIAILVSPPDSSDFKINHMDKKLDRIMEHLGMEKMNIDEELRELLAEGKRIPAIKRLREETGMGLKEAKEYVDDLENETSR